MEHPQAINNIIQVDRNNAFVFILSFIL